MRNVGKWMLAAAVVASGLGMSAPKANAQIGIYVRTGRAIPPCPGPGYSWVNAYYDEYGNYVPGYWNYVGVSTYGGGGYYGYSGGYDRDRYWDHERREHEWREHERHEWREREHREHEWREHHGDDDGRRGW